MVQSGSWGREEAAWEAGRGAPGVRRCWYEPLWRLSAGRMGGQARIGFVLMIRPPRRLGQQEAMDATH